MDSNSRDAMASTLQSRNRLENRRGKNDEVSRRVWKAVKAGSGEVRLGKQKEEEEKEEVGKKREEKKKKKNKEEERQWR